MFAFIFLCCLLVDPIIDESIREMTVGQLQAKVQMMELQQQMDALATEQDEPDVADRGFWGIIGAGIGAMLSSALRILFQKKDD